MPRVRSAKQRAASSGSRRTVKQRAASGRNVRRAHMARVRTHEPRSIGRVRPVRRTR